MLIETNVLLLPLHGDMECKLQQRQNRKTGESKWNINLSSLADAKMSSCGWKSMELMDAEWPLNSVCSWPPVTSHSYTTVQYTASALQYTYSSSQSTHTHQCPDYLTNIILCSPAVQPHGSQCWTMLCSLQFELATQNQQLIDRSPKTVKTAWAVFCEHYQNSLRRTRFPMLCSCRLELSQYWYFVL